MKYLVAMMLGWSLVCPAQAAEPSASPEETIRQLVTADELRFFLNEARQAARAAARGGNYAPSPETANRAKEIGIRVREKGFGLMEVLLDQIEQELLNAFPGEPSIRQDATVPPDNRPKRTQT